MTISSLSLIVGLGGFIGSALRYQVGVWIGVHSTPAFPWATFAVNIIGCFLIGLLLAEATKGRVSHEWKFFLSTGICGGFTTFSAFSAETLSLLQHGAHGMAAGYIAASVVGGLLAAAAGYALMAR